MSGGGDGLWEGCLREVPGCPQTKASFLGRLSECPSSLVPFLQAPSKPQIDPEDTPPLNQLLLAGQGPGRRWELLARAPGTPFGFLGAAMAFSGLGSKWTLPPWEE